MSTSTTGSTTKAEVAPASAAMTAALQTVWQTAPGGCALVTSGDRIVYEANADRPVVPASVTKILTATAALDILGADTRFTTAVVAEIGPGGVVEGNLWVVGGGDPVLGTDAWATRDGAQAKLHTSLDQLADRVVAAGVRRVAKDVVGDETRFDAQRVVPSWPRRLVADGEAGPLSALVANDGFRVWGHPGLPFTDPAAGTAGLLLELLEQRGVDVGGDAVSGRAAEGRQIASVTSPTVSDLVTEVLRESDNETAELLVKEMGLRRRGAGTTASGVRAVTAALADRGVPMANTVVADGSGLSSRARVTCRALSAVLTRAEPILADRLAVAAQSGTLRNRLRATPAAGRVRAKTGSLDGMSGLAGYADTVSGRVAFVYLVNGLPVPTRTPTVQDPFVLALVTAGP